MIIDEFNLVGVAVPPNKAYAPLVVDPDAVLAEAVVSERFQHVARRYGQGFQPGCGVNLQELPKRGPLGLGTEPLGGPTPENLLGVSIAEAFDHLP